MPELSVNDVQGLIYKVEQAELIFSGVCSIDIGRAVQGQSGESVMIITRKVVYLLVLVALLLGGCTAYDTFPYEVKAGDTITLAVGSPDGMTRNNTTASFISEADPGNPVDITLDIRAIFKLYADQASLVCETATVFTEQLVKTSGHAPSVTVVVIDLPTGLPTGPARIEFSTTATYPTAGSHINDLPTNAQPLVDGGFIDPPIALNILPGTGTPTDFLYELGKGWFMTGDLTWLEAQPHAQVSPPFEVNNPLGWPEYGAIELTMTLDTDLDLTSSLYRVVVDDMTFYTNSHRSVLSGINGNELTVMLTSPEGKLQYYEPRFAVVLDSSVNFSQVPSPATISSVQFYDIDGNLVAGPLVSDFSVEIR